MGNSSSAIETLSCCLCFNERSKNVSPRSEYFSPRIEAMMQSRSQNFASDNEHEIEFSKSHWSEVTESTVPLSSNEDRAEEDGQNWKLFEELMNDPQWTHPVTGEFFQDWRGVKLGEKIAEGGQAEIFEFNSSSDGTMHSDALLKVFKRGSLLQLRQQWPQGILQYDVPGCVHYGTLLANDRFAFVMLRGWGNLRKLIDQAMIEKNNECPPFPYVWAFWDGKTVDAVWIMNHIALYMDSLHEEGFFHRDLKASNILLFKDEEVFLADFECSIGVVGTTFWRAPEILLALKNGNPIIFMEKADVYNYGMTCFEIVTGCMPFEGELEPCKESYDFVIEGQRPKLPSSLDVRVKNLISQCWDSNPKNRSTFNEICSICFTFESIE